MCPLRAPLGPVAHAGANFHHSCLSVSLSQHHPGKPVLLKSHLKQLSAPAVYVLMWPVA
jgi:hypothetical protein